MVPAFSNRVIRLFVEARLVRGLLNGAVLIFWAGFTPYKGLVGCFYRAHRDYRYGGRFCGWHGIRFVFPIVSRCPTVALFMPR